MKNTMAELEPVAVKLETAAKMLDISRASVYRMLGSGELERVTIPGRRAARVSVASIRRLASK